MASPTHSFCETRLDVPQYQVGEWGAWSLELAKPMFPDGSVALAGYWAPMVHFPAPHILRRDRRVWMSTSAMELESQMPAVHYARGHTVIAGLGMGVALLNIARKPAVKRVTVLEKDAEVIAAFRHFADTDTWAGWDKVRVVQVDALTAKAYEPGSGLLWEQRPDFLYADIWSQLGSERAMGDTRRMQSWIRAKSVYVWGQEFDFVAWCHEEGHRPNGVGIDEWRTFRATSGLPLVPTDSDTYPALALQAVSNQLR